MQSLVRCLEMPWQSSADFSLPLLPSPCLAASVDWAVLAKDWLQEESSDLAEAHHHRASAEASLVKELPPLSLLMRLFLALFERRVDH